MQAIKNLDKRHGRVVCETGAWPADRYREQGMVGLNNLKRASLVWATWMVLALVAVGCARTPRIYTMQPEGLEAIRSEISTIGVCISPEPPESEVMLPAKGGWGGLKRGIVVGARLPIMIGLASPIPGGTFLGVMVSPLGAIIGGIHGIATAVPAEEIEHAEVVLEIAAENIRKRKLRDAFMQNLIDLGNSRTELTFVVWQETEGQTHSQNHGQSSDPLEKAPDAQLWIEFEKVGLQGAYSIDPPIDTFVQVHVKLIRLPDNRILLDERFTCASDEERTYQDWADQDGSDLICEFRDCVPELTEKIIDDFFMVYPIHWSDDG